MSRIVGGILIGGQSRRMQQPKHLLRRGDASMLERTADLLQAVCHEVIILGGGPLPDDCNLPQVADADGYDGPLAGVRAGLAYDAAGTLLVVGCDYPRLDAAALRWLLETCTSERAGVVPQTPDAQLQPLLAWYRSLLGKELDLRQPLRSMAARQLAGLPGVETVRVPEQLAGSWRSANTPEDWSALPAE